MSALDFDAIETVSCDVEARILGDSLLSPLAVFVEEKGVIESEFESSLGTMNVQREGGKIGVVLQILQPFERSTDLDNPGAESRIHIAVRVTERPTVNRATEFGGSGLTWARIGYRLKQILHNWAPAEYLRLVFGGMDPIPMTGEGEVARDYIFVALTGVAALPKPVRPSITGDLSAVVVACLTPATTCYFTTDGQMPVPGRDNTTLFSTAFAVDAGTLVRAVALADGFQGSDGATAQF